MIYFNSDYLEGAHPALMAKLNETNMVQTIGYGEDEYCAAARVKIQNACQAPEADVHFLVGGTQTNTTVIAAVLRPWQGVLCAVSGHINCHEAGAIESTGHKVITLPTTNGKITAQQVQEYVEWHRNDESTEHIVQPGMVYISYPTEGGTLYSKAELTELYDVCRRYGLPLFIDGARLGYGVMADGADLTLPEIAHLCDVFYIGGTKVGALKDHAVLAAGLQLHLGIAHDLQLLLLHGGLIGVGQHDIHSLLVKDLSAVHPLDDLAGSLAGAEAGDIHLATHLQIGLVDSLLEFFCADLDGQLDLALFQIFTGLYTHFDFSSVQRSFIINIDYK